MQRKSNLTSQGSNLITAATLMGMKLKQPRFVLPGLVPTGLTICAAKPKVGKSWWCLGLSVAVSSGSRFMEAKVAQGEVLYLALEDTLGRVKARLAKVCAEHTPSDSLYINADEWNRLDEGGLDQIDSWLKSHRRARLVVIDTLGKVAPRRRRSGYLAEYEILASLKSMADRRRVSIVAVTHLRKKASAGDWTDDILGSTAVSGAADCLLHLSRPRGDHDAVLRVTGRDVEEREVPLRFDPNRGTFELVREARSSVLSPERQAIRAFVEAADNPVGPKVVYKALGLPYGSTRKLMVAMARQGIILRVLSGYVPAKDGSQTGGSTGSSGSLGTAAPSNVVRFPTRTSPGT